MYVEYNPNIKFDTQLDNTMSLVSKEINKNKDVSHEYG